MLKALVAAGVTAALFLPSAAPATAHSAFTPGAAGAGDTYFPDMGNGGYLADHYDISLTYTPKTRAISATTVVTAHATQNLSSFDLDFRGPLTISRLSVDGKPARYRRTGAQELVISPAGGVAKGRRFNVAVSYAGVPKAIDDATLGVSGWVATANGAVALNQPFGAATYYPVNDTPNDKATYSQAITVPSGLQALANGEPGPTTTSAGLTTYRWQMRQPMASELSMIAIGKYTITKSSAIGGIADISAIATPLDTKPGQDGLFNRTTAAIVAWESGRYGRYPFASTGGIIDKIGVDYALETQSRPVYDQDSSDVDGDLLAHELAHQWFGDSLTPTRWSDIWLNEGFATYSEWLWQATYQHRPVSSNFAKTYATTTDWSGKVADPGRDHIFDPLVYDRGAMTLYQLSKTIGAAAFNQLLTQWPSQHRYRNVSTAEFIAFVEKLTHRDLTSFFHTWLYSPGKPAV